jgi:catechol 2,3-dioxygenase-like lactoylglutathione lyase family enzyme
LRGQNQHIAISTQDVDATARFYIEVFGLKEVGKVDSPGARGYYLNRRPSRVGWISAAG